MSPSDNLNTISSKKDLQDSIQRSWEQKKSQKVDEKNIPETASNVNKFTLNDSKLLNFDLNSSQLLLNDDKSLERVTTQLEIFDSYLDKPPTPPPQFDQNTTPSHLEMSPDLFSNGDIHLKLKTDPKKDDNTPEKARNESNEPQTAAFKSADRFEQEIDSHMA